MRPNNKKLHVANAQVSNNKEKSKKCPRSELRQHVQHLLHFVTVEVRTRLRQNLNTLQPPICIIHYLGLAADIGRFLPVAYEMRMNPACILNAVELQFGNWIGINYKKKVS